MICKLSPLHIFLIGDSMMSLPEPSLKDSSLNTEFLNGQRMFRLFWRKWSADWLSHLQARPKWRHETGNLQRNDMIIIQDDRTGPSDWKLGRIIDLHPGADGLVRGLCQRFVVYPCQDVLKSVAQVHNPCTFEYTRIHSITHFNLFRVKHGLRLWILGPVLGAAWTGVSVD